MTRARPHPRSPWVLSGIGIAFAAGGFGIPLPNGDSGLTFLVVDNGLGFDPATNYGTGLQGIADRLAAFGGSLEMISSPGAGTTVRGSVPLTPDVQEVDG